MLEISFGSLVDLLIIILFVQQMQAQVPQPTCIFNKKGISPKNESFRYSNGSEMIADCQITREKDHCFSNTENLNDCEIIIHFVENNSEHAYINAMIICHRREISTILLVQRTTSKCWNVKVAGGEYPYNISINNLQVTSSDPKDDFAAGILTSDSSVSSRNICNQLTSTKLNFDQIPTMNQLRLIMKVKVDGMYKVEILSGNCNITCSGNNSGCNVGIESENIYNLTSEERNETILYNVTPSKYYCARIGTEDDCDYIHSDTVMIDEKIKKMDNPVLSFQIIPTITIIVIFTFIMAMLLFLLCKLYSFIRALKSPMKQAAEEGSNALVLESHILQIIEEMRDNAEVFLVYPYDCQKLLDLISSFRLLLQSYVKKVWDPISDEDTEIFAENISFTVQRLLSNPNMRIIIIETKEVVITEKHLIEGQNKLPGHYNHFLNDAYINSLALVMTNIDFYSDYSRVFIVRLQPDINGKLNITNYRRYLMPDHFETLIYSMSRCRTRNIDCQDFTKYIHQSEEQENFINKIETYNKLNR